MKKYIFGLIILLLILTDGCRCKSKVLGISSNSDNENAAPYVTTPEISVIIAENPTHPSDFIFTIDLKDAVNASGIAFRLNYDPEIIQIKNIDNPENSVSKGAFFDQGGIATGLGVGFLQNYDSTLSDTTLSGSSLSDSSLVLGLSRVGGNPGVDGSGTIMQFTFTTVSAGSTSIKFSDTGADNSLFSPENPLESISFVKWTNAEITVK